MRNKLVKLIIALDELDIKTIQELLDKCKTHASRREFVKALEITDIELVKLVKTANLIRIEGIGEREVEMLEAVGVDTVKELASRNATDLSKKLESYGADKNISIPSEEEVTKWIEQAKKLNL